MNRHQLDGYANLATETVEGLTSTLERVDDIKSRDGLASGVLSVGDSIADDAIEEEAEDRASLLVDLTGDTADTTTTCETSDSGLSDAQVSILSSRGLAVTLCTGLAKTLTTLTAASHCCSCYRR